MDKYEFNIKVDQIKKRVSEGDYKTAMKIADSIDWTRVRNTNLLSVIAEIYEKNGEIQEAKEKLLLAFERAPKGKRLLYKLTELSVKSGDLEEAQDFYNEFKEIAPDDISSLLLQYTILSAMHAPIEQRIQVLEAYNSLEPDDKWLYELAVNYDLAGDSQNCIRACDRLTLLFGAGKYSDKAMKLKQKYTSLSDYQKSLAEEKINKSVHKEELINAPVGVLAEQSDALKKETDNKVDLIKISEETSIADKVEADMNISSRPIITLDEDASDKFEKSKIIRYENEDAIFEAYLKDHHLDAFSLEETKINYKEVMPDNDISYEDTSAKDRLSDVISREVIGSLKDADTVSEDDILKDSTRVLDNECIEKLRSVIIKDDKLLRKPETEANTEVKEDISSADESTDKESENQLLKDEAPDNLSENTSEEAHQETETAEFSSDSENVSEETEEMAVAEETEEKAKAEIEESAEEITEEREPVPVYRKPQLQARTSFTSGSEEPANEEPIIKKHDDRPRYHMIIESENLEEGLEVAIDELKYIHKEQGINHPAAKTTAEKLNNRGLSRSSLEKIKGKDFIIVGAGSLKEEIAEQIYQLIQMDRSGMIVVLIDIPEGLDRLERIKPEIFELCDLVTDFEDEYEDEDGYKETEDSDESSVIIDKNETEETYEEDNKDTHSDIRSEKEVYFEDASEQDYTEEEREEISEEESSDKLRTRGTPQAKNDKLSNVKAHIPESYTEEMDIDDFAQYCCQYATMVECSITGKSMLALYERIELMEEDNIPLNKQTAEDLIEEAADRAEKPPISKRIKGLFRSKYDKSGFLILKEDDFIY